MYCLRGVVWGFFVGIWLYKDISVYGCVGRNRKLGVVWLFVSYWGVEWYIFVMDILV